jgi:multidrug efflux pump subunit AcrB
VRIFIQFALRAQLCQPVEFNDNVDIDVAADVRDAVGRIVNDLPRTQISLRSSRPMPMQYQPSCGSR